MDQVRKLRPDWSTEVGKIFAYQEMQMLQATAVVDHRVPPTAAKRRAPSRPLSSWLFVAGAFGLVAVTIDLVKGPAANALPTPAAHGAPLGTLAIDHSVVKHLVDGESLQPGASVAAYDRSTEASAMPLPASALRAPIDEAAPVSPASAADRGAFIDHSALANQGVDSTLEPGASVAAYGS